MLARALLVLLGAGVPRDGPRPALAVPRGLGPNRTAAPRSNASRPDAYRYHEFGNVAAESAIHRRAVEDYARIARDLVGLELSTGPGAFDVFVYEYASMADWEIVALIEEYCRVLDAPAGCITEENIREGDVCGGVCGPIEHMVMDFAAGEQHRDPQWGHARIQEYTVHETTHIFQRQNSAPAYENDLGGDVTEDWRANGCRWWMEGTAVWLGDRVLNAYPEFFSAPDPDRTNFGRTLAQVRRRCFLDLFTCARVLLRSSPFQNCESLNHTEEETGLRLTNAAQASDEPWQEMFALGKYYEMVYVSPLPTFRRWPLD